MALGKLFALLKLFDMSLQVYMFRGNFSKHHYIVEHKLFPAQYTFIVFKNTISKKRKKGRTDKKKTKRLPNCYQYKHNAYLLFCTW